MNSTGSISGWIYGLKLDDADAQERILNRFFDQLVRRANSLQNQHGIVRQKEGPDDIALRTLNSVFVRMRQGKFPELKKRLELQALFATIVRRKVANQLMDELARRPKLPCNLDTEVNRDPENTPTDVGESRNRKGNVYSLDESNIDLASSRFGSQDLVNLVDLELAQFDEESRRIIELTLAGYTNEEVATETGISLATVERRKRQMREAMLLDEFLSLIQDIRCDKTLLARLKPTTETLVSLLGSTDLSSRLQQSLDESYARYAEQAFHSLLRAGRDQQPVRALAVNREKLIANQCLGLPNVYVSAAKLLRRGVVILAVAIGQESHRHNLIDAFVYLNNRWKFIPRLGEWLHSMAK